MQCTLLPVVLRLDPPRSHESKLPLLLVLPSLEFIPGLQCHTAIIVSHFQHGSAHDSPFELGPVIHQSYDACVPHEILFSELHVEFLSCAELVVRDTLLYAWKWHSQYFLKELSEPGSLGTRYSGDVLGDVEFARFNSLLAQLLDSMALLGEIYGAYKLQYFRAFDSCV